MNPQIKIEYFTKPAAARQLNEPYYLILLFDGATSFSIDFTEYTCDGKCLIFLSPYQLLKWHKSNAAEVSVLKFHGDFYCIEYHKQEVACNGILFNNIFAKPFIQLPPEIFNEVKTAFQKIKILEKSEQGFDVSITKSYLQLILALSSKEKQTVLLSAQKILHTQPAISDFHTLLEEHFISNRSISFYAANYGLSANAFSKQIKNHFGKTPSKLIQERLSLEAKRLLHLTFKNIKQIAAELGFEDEFYFSRYFKNEVGVSPKVFRKKTGISIVAK